MKQSFLKPQFVEFIPEKLQNGVLYISMSYATATHLCCCGCGKEVVTPFTPTDWRMTFDGTVSINPSIGNWSFKCRSHYWITGNRVKWAGDMDQRKIDAGRLRDKQAKEQFYGKTGIAQSSIRDSQNGVELTAQQSVPRSGWLAAIQRWWSS